MKKNLLIIGGVVVALLVVVGLARPDIYQEAFNVLGGTPTDDQMATTTDKSSDAAGDFLTDADGNVGIIVTEDPNTLPRYAGDPIVNLGNDPIIQQVPQQYVNQYIDELFTLEGQVTAQPADVDAWIRIGFLKKFFNNYVGARDAWEYAKLVAPRHPVPYHNLGDLYGYFLRDLPKAEQNFLKAIEVEPNFPYLYLALVDFYNSAYKQKQSQIDDILERGLRVLPNDESLKQTLESYKAGTY